MEQNKQILIDTNLTMSDFVSTVDNIALEYFDENGEYQPHIGLLNTMRLFYNQCVKDSKFDVEHNIIDALEMEAFIYDDEFIKSFNKAIIGNGNFAMNFSTAYAEAMDIVSQKKSSINNAVDKVKYAIINIAEKMNGVLTKDNIDKVVKIFGELSNSKSSIDTAKDVMESINLEKIN